MPQCNYELNIQLIKFDIKESEITYRSVCTTAFYIPYMYHVLLQDWIKRARLGLMRAVLSYSCGSYWPVEKLNW